MRHMDSRWSGAVWSPLDRSQGNRGWNQGLSVFQAGLNMPMPAWPAIHCRFTTYDKNSDWRHLPMVKY